MRSEPVRDLEAAHRADQTISRNGSTSTGYRAPPAGSLIVADLQPAGPENRIDDLVTMEENNGSPTHVAVTARSWHNGGVNAMFADGSVRFVKDTVDGNIWRALGTVAGGEVISADQF